VHDAQILVHLGEKEMNPVHYFANHIEQLGNANGVGMIIGNKIN